MRSEASETVLASSLANILEDSCALVALGCSGRGLIPAALLNDRDYGTRHSYDEARTVQSVSLSRPLEASRVGI